MIFYVFFLICTSCVSQLSQTNPGFNNTPFKFTKYSNAYMLVYIRESDKEKIMCNVDEKDIAEHLRVSSTSAVGQLREVSNKAHNAELKLFLEVELGLVIYISEDLHPVPPPQKTKEDILLFFKLYDPEKEGLR
ncbi:hypothetical protein BHE74_00019051 [Ensete ventricosum]|uniref:Uncharacterized protein n=1 Tax=Ensete ventricosum TaxID=4639 RepID=A0A426ZMQ6_ENSVE|nr:hypothetical protein B296_00018050 [Ensete ventricosum]RWW10293.1 hypothetical protein GW17_00026173 [Ensete ventricosum]RWW73096.1 hypothetical protein BHE74_00019051 [Ensete ventricosum]